MNRARFCKWPGVIAIILLVAGCIETPEEVQEVLDDGYYEPVDYSQYWVGEYNGAADIYNADNGQTTDDTSIWISIGRGSENKIQFRLNSYYISDAIGSASYFNGSHQSGAYRNSVSVTHS